MIHSRRNAYLASLFMLVGVAGVIAGTLLPVITLSSIIGLDFSHVSVDLGSDVGIADLLPLAVAFGVMILVLAALLAITRRRGVGIVWRLLALAALTAPAFAAGTYWYYVANPDKIVSNGDFAVRDRVLAAGAAIGVGDASPGLGLWLLSVGCLIVLIGCFVPSKKSKRLIIDEGDPGFAQYNPYVDQFRRYEAQRQWTSAEHHTTADYYY